MKHFLLIIIIISALGGCITEEKAGKPDYLNGIIYIDEVLLSGNPFKSLLSTYNEDSDILFLGVSPNLRNEDEEIRRAIRDAASQAVKYGHIKGFVGLFVASIGSKGIISDKFKIEWEEKAVNDMIGRMDIKRVVKDKNGTYVVAALNSEPADYVLKDIEMHEGIPEWFLNTPVIEGYHAGVGGTRTGRLFSESIQRADEMALASIITTFDSQFYSGVTTLDDSEMGTYDRMLVISRAEIYGFHVISRWMSNDGEYIYSLGICKGGNSFE